LPVWGRTLDRTVRNLLHARYVITHLLIFLNPFLSPLSSYPPSFPSSLLLSPLLLCPLSSSLYFSGTIYVFLVEMEDGKVSSRDRTMTFTTFVMFDMFNALACRHNSRPIFELNWNSNKAFLLALAFSLIGQLVVLYFPPLQKVFRTVGLSFSDLIFVITLSSSMLVLDTIRKKYFSSVFTEVLSNDSFRSDKGKKVVDKNGSFMV
jgi:magnesium-transporting ATPase (P-type)